MKAGLLSKLGLLLAFLSIEYTTPQRQYSQRRVVPARRTVLPASTGTHSVLSGQTPARTFPRSWSRQNSLLSSLSGAELESLRRRWIARGNDPRDLELILGEARQGAVNLNSRFSDRSRPRFSRRDPHDHRETPIDHTGHSANLGNSILRRGQHDSHLHRDIHGHSDTGLHSLDTHRTTNDLHRHADTHGHRDTHVPVDTHGHRDTHGHVDTHGHRDTHVPVDTHGHRDTHGHVDTNGHGDTHWLTGTQRHVDTHGHVDTHRPPANIFNNRRVGHLGGNVRPSTRTTVRNRNQTRRPVSRTSRRRNRRRRRRRLVGRLLGVLG